MAESSFLLAMIAVAGLLWVILVITRPPRDNNHLQVAKSRIPPGERSGKGSIKVDGETPRAWGTWTPDLEFRYPSVQAWTDFDIDAVKPIPYRPFRWGPNYPITLGISSMPWDHWIELDNHYRKTVNIRKQRTALRGSKAHQTRQGFLPHAEECLAEICSFLSVRYPSHFRVVRALYRADDASTWGDSISGRQAGAVAGITNLITGDSYDFRALRQMEGSEWDPMKYAGLLQHDDLAVMVEDDQGEYRFQAGSICTAGFWRLEDKIGRSLKEIHMSGKVPQFESKLKFSMERFFQKQKVATPVQRNNYFFQVDDQLAWSEHTNGPEDIFDQGTKAPRPECISEAGFQAPKPASDFDDIWFRTERQTLRRMPRTGCILFTIRTYFHPVRELVQEPGVPGRMADAIRSWPEDVAEYKGGSLYAVVLLPRLDELHAAQIQDGLVQLDEDGNVKDRNVRTYPF